MKTICIFCALTLQLSAQVNTRPLTPVIGTQFRDSIVASGMQRAWLAQQWRVVDGKTNNLSDTNWFLIEGSVAQNHGDGLRVNSSVGEVFLIHAPEIADAQPVSVWAKEVGLHRYSTAMGSHRTLRKFDCGREVFAPAPLAIREAPARPLTREEEAALGDRVLKYQRAEAEKGLPSFQFIMGQRYWNGDGVAKDHVRAREWYERAATNGSSEAREALGRAPEKRDTVKP